MKTDFQKRAPAPFGGDGASHPLAGSRIGDRLEALRREGSASQRTIAAFVLAHPIKSASAGIEDLSAAVGVSATTLSRFARLAGAGGYAALRRDLADALQGSAGPVERLRAALDAPPGGASPITDGVEATLAGARAGAAGLDPARLAAIAEWVASARCVYVMGFGLSGPVAGLLALGMQPFCEALVNVAESGGDETAAGRLMPVGPADALVVVALPRYAGTAVRLARYARDRGARVVAITDGPASPLVPLADAVLLAPGAHPVMANTTVPAVLAAEALVTALMISRRANVERAARLTEAIAGYLHDPRAGRGRA